MDPLSLAASVITVATVATQTGNVFLKLRGLHKAIPGRLHALNNEVVDIELVLHQVAVVVREREGLPAREREQGDLEHLLVQAKTKLGELRAMVNRLCESCVNGKSTVFRGYIWQKEQERLQGLRKEINSVKCSLNIILGTSHSYVDLTFWTYNLRWVPLLDIEIKYQTRYGASSNRCWKYIRRRRPIFLRPPFQMNCSNNLISTTW